jgi:RNA 2',3'-cyclic 3'-phosphodiesterase
VRTPGSVEGDEHLRLFCALRLPPDVLDRLEAWQRGHVTAGRAVPRENLHATLAFLGRRPSSELPAITTALREAARGSKEIVLAVERYRETRSAGMLVLEDRTGEGTRLAERLFERLEALGVYRREQRPWLPHVTVVRYRERPRLHPPLPDLGAFTPSDAAVFMSSLRPSGAEYAVLEAVPLGG